MSFIHESCMSYRKVLGLIEDIRERRNSIARPCFSEKKAKEILQTWTALPDKGLPLFTQLYEFSSREYFKRALLEKSPREAAQKKQQSKRRLRIEIEDSQASFEILYDTVASPFGHCFLALAGDRICKLSFIDSHKSHSKKKGIGQRREKKNAQSKEVILDELRHFWPKAQIKASSTQTESSLITSLSSEIFFPKTNRALRPKTKNFPLLMRGSVLELGVWRALLDLAEGDILSYSQLAQAIGRPRAVRPVARAVAKNPISYLVPCHRIISKSGEAHAYRWGRERKLSMLLWEGLASQRLVYSV